MAQRAIREYDGKRLLRKYWHKYFEGIQAYDGRIILIDSKTDINKLPEKHPWLKTEKLVVKPDQLFGKRGKHKLILLNAKFEEAKKWIKERMNKEFTLDKVKDKLSHFLLEPFVPHEQNKEYYVAITSHRNYDKIHFSLKGGVDIEDLWSEVKTAKVPVLSNIEDIAIEEKILKNVPEKEKETLWKFIKGLFTFYSNLGFTYLELNPFVIIDNKKVVPLDLVARIDDAAKFLYEKKWDGLEFPAPFGMKLTSEERFIRELDEKSGASLKLAILNPKGRIWTLVAGGGASIIYADTIADLGFGKELGNYGEYSGDPSEEETYLYTKTILKLMLKEKDPRGKILIIGGAIANFTDVAATFKGIIRALEEYKKELKERKVKIYVRRGGPNYKEGLKLMSEVGEKLGLSIKVFGPEMHMTSIIPMALKG
jgi:ATP-citrate lyase beta-subunit